MSPDTGMTNDLFNYTKERPDLWDNLGEGAKARGKCHAWKGTEYEYTVAVVHKLKLFVFEEGEKGQKETTILQKFFLLSGYPAFPTYHRFFPTYQCAWKLLV